MSTNIFFPFFVCAIFAFWFTICSSSRDSVILSKKTWRKLNPDAQYEAYKHLLDEQQRLLDEQQRLLDEQEKTLYDRFICAASIIRRCGDTLYKEVNDYLKRRFIYINRYQPDVGKEEWFQNYFNDWRFKTYQRNRRVHKVITRICPQNRIRQGTINQKEYLDYIQNSGSKYAEQLRKLLPTLKLRKYFAALIPCSYYKMCPYLHSEGSAALKMYENGTMKSLPAALINYNHWKINTRDIRLLNMVLSVISNFQLSAKVVTDDHLAFPTADLKTGCDIDLK